MQSGSAESSRITDRKSFIFKTTRYMWEHISNLKSKTGSAVSDQWDDESCKHFNTKQFFPKMWEKCQVYMASWNSYGRRRLAASLTRTPAAAASAKSENGTIFLFFLKSAEVPKPSFKNTLFMSCLSFCSELCWWFKHRLHHIFASSSSFYKDGFVWTRFFQNLYFEPI